LKPNKTLFPIEYDLVEDLKKLRENISFFELLKFPLILQKMLQSIAHNNKKNDPMSKKSAENDANKTKYVTGKKSTEDQTKRDILEKTLGNLDKTILGTSVKIQQTFAASSRKNVLPFFLTFENFNINVHNCMVDYGASSNVIPLSVCQKSNAEVKPSDLKIIQIDKTNVKVISELKNVLIKFSSNPKVHQVIDIIVVDKFMAYF